MLVILLITGLVGGYLALGALVVLLDWIDRRRKRCMTLSWSDTLLMCFVWPYLVYLLRRGINLDNT